LIDSAANGRPWTHRGKLARDGAQRFPLMRPLAIGIQGRVALSCSNGADASREIEASQMLGEPRN
jgi:hypothetical protein